MLPITVVPTNASNQAQPGPHGRRTKHQGQRQRPTAPPTQTGCLRITARSDTTTLQAIFTRGSRVRGPMAVVTGIGHRDGAFLAASQHLPHGEPLVPLPQVLGLVGGEVGERHAHRDSVWRRPTACSISSSVGRRQGRPGTGM